MSWFDTYVSNTLGGTGCQVHFGTDGGAQTGRIYYKIFSGGKFHYSLYFSNTIDSTYKPEYQSYANLPCGQWNILDAAIGICSDVDMEVAGDVADFIPLTFDGERQKTVLPGECFSSDPVVLEAEKGQYLCYQITFEGQMLPYHLESVLPTFVKKDGTWIPDKKVPVPSMIGCDRQVTARIGYLGDSITQGIGTCPNSYDHWCALVSEAIGDQNSYWNLGIGYGRGQDAASNGAWLSKAKQMDAVVVAYGSNDVGRGRTLEQMKQDMTTIVAELKKSGIKVFLISVPPFNWKEDFFDRWTGINEYLVNTLSKEADGFLDVAPLLTSSEEPGMAIYGTHPDEEGCKVWADAMLPLFRKFLEN